MLYHTASRRHVVVNSGHGKTEGARLDAERVLAWRPDSRACAVGGMGGWCVVWPRLAYGKVGYRRLRLTAAAPGYQSCAAWSPRTYRLAMFDGFLGTSLYRVWNGRRLSRGIVWREAVGFPQGEERAWQCEWSPDEKSLFLRFYGHAERDSTSAGHLVVLNPRTARPRYRWGAEAQPARWLDNRRLIFGHDDSGLPYPEPLTVVQPSTYRHSAWLPAVVAWALSPARDVLWALQSNGDVRRRSTRARRNVHSGGWQTLYRLKSSVDRRAEWPTIRQQIAALCISPRGDMVAFARVTHNETTPAAPPRAPRPGEAEQPPSPTAEPIVSPPHPRLTLLGTNPRRRWILAGNLPDGHVQIIGWRQGRSLPLVLWQRHGANHAVLLQLVMLHESHPYAASD